MTNELTILFWALVIVWVARASARFAWSITGRIFGFYDPETYSKFLGQPGWRGIYRPLLLLREWFSERLYGRRATAKWASILERLSLVWTSGKIYLGPLQIAGIRLNQPIGISGERHISVIANSGAGKSNLLTSMIALHTSPKKRSGNAFVVDCDGKIFNTLHAQIRATGKEVLAIDPYKQTGSTASWNIFAEFDFAEENLGEDAAIDFIGTASEALIRTLNTRNEWVHSEARSLVFSLLIFVWKFEKPENRNLIRFRELLTIGMRGVVPDADPFMVLIGVMSQKTEIFGGIIAKGAKAIAASQGADGRNIPLTDARDQTKFLDLPYIQKICKKSNFKCADLKGNLSLFLVAPVTDLQTKLSPFVRMLTMMTMEIFQKVGARNQEVLLMVLDEMPSIGKIDILATAAPVFRKYGIRLVTVAQTVGKTGNLAATYPDEWEDFLANSEACIWMSNSHIPTLEHLSSLLGTTTRKEKLKPSIWRRARNIEKTQTQRVERPLMYPHQLALYLDRNVIVTRSGKRPLRIKRGDYFKELPVKKYSADPHYGESIGRSLYRAIRFWILNDFRSQTATHLESARVKTNQLVQKLKGRIWHKNSILKGK